MKFRSQNILTIISVGLMLFFVGLYVVISWQSDYFIDLVKEKIDLLVELEDNASQAEVSEFMIQLDSMPEVKSGSPEYISKEEALSDMKAEFGEDFFLEGMENPFSNAISFRLNAEFYKDEQMRNLKNRLEEKAFVKSLSYRQDVFEPMKHNMNRISKVIFILGILLIFGALVLIHNTLKLSLNSQRRVIKTMELVGARTGFILRPYLLQGLLQGIGSGLVASLGILLILNVMGRWIPVFKTLYYTEESLLVMGALVLLGVLIFISVTYFTVKRYLRLQMEDIF